MTIIGETLGKMGFGRGPVEVPPNVHRYIVGSTGSGKTTLLKRLILADIEVGDGVLVIDPHGTEGSESLVGDVVARIPKNRIRDVIWFDPLGEKPIGLNPLQGGTKLDVDEFIEVISRIYGETSWGGRSAWVARNFGYAVQEAIPHFTPWHIQLCFMVDAFRKRVFSRVKDPALKMFYQKFEVELPDRTRQEAEVAPLNKVDALNGNYLLRHVFGQKKGLDLFRAMEDARIILCPLSSGRMGEEATALFGSMLLNQVLFAALKRKQGSRPFKVYVDEAHTLTRGNRINRILSELRKYGVFLTLADQLVDEDNRRDIYTNVGTLIAGKCEHSLDLANQFGVEPEVLQRAGRGEWYVRTIRTDGNTSDTIHAQSDDLKGKPNPRIRKKAILRSRARYGAFREKVEKQLNRILEVCYARRNSINGSRKGNKNADRNRKSPETPGTVRGGEEGSNRRTPRTAPGAG